MINTVAINCFVAVVYIFLAKTGLFFALKSPLITIFWPAGGFALALLLLGGLRNLPGIFVGGVIAGFMAVDNPWVAMMLGVADVMESLTAYWLLTYYFRFSLALESLQDFFKLAVVTAFIASTVSALIGVTALLFGNIIPENLYPKIVMRWWMGDVLGIAFITPLLLIWRNLPQKSKRPIEIVELLVVISLTILAGQIIFFDWLADSEYVPHGIAWIILLIIWAGLRLGRHYTTLLQLIIFIQSLWSVSQSVGHFADDMVQSGLVNFWIFGMVLAVGGLALALMSFENRMATDSLSRSEHHLRSILDSTSECVKLVAADGTVLSMNQAGLYKLEADSPDQVINKDVYALIAPEHHDGFKQLLERVCAGIPGSLEFEVIGLKGTRRWMESRAVPFEWRLTGEVVQLAFTQEITERKCFERALQISEERFRTISSITTDLIFACQRGENGDFKIDWIGGNALPLFGLSNEELMALGCWRSFVVTEDQLLFDRNIVQLRPGQSTRCVVRVIHRNGSQRFVNCFVRAAEDSGIRNKQVLYGGLQDITEQKLTEQALRASENFANAVIDSVTENICVLDELGNIVAVNHAWKEFYDLNQSGNPSPYGIGLNYLNICNSATYPELTDAAMMAEGILKVISGELSEFSMEYPCHSPAEQRWFLAKVTPFKSNRANVVVAHENITERKRTESKLQLAASVFTHAREGIIITDMDANIIDVNNTFTQITGYSHEDVVGKNPRILQSGRQHAEFYADMWMALMKQGFWSGEIWSRRKNGEMYASLLTISAVRDANGRTLNYVGLFTDITPMKEQQRQLEHIAHYDPLTNLPNRVLLADRLQQALNQCQRRQKMLAVVYLDLDGFKDVNDRYGHRVGDDLLVTVSQRMQDAVREGDTLARVGGDEFVAILVDLVQMADCEQVLDRLLTAASKPVNVDDLELTVSVSMGVSLYPQDGSDAELLLHNADQTMYTAKQSGKNRYHVFDKANQSA